MNTTVSMHRFNIEEYHRLTESNILHEDDRVELVESSRIRDIWAASLKSMPPKTN